LTGKENRMITVHHLENSRSHRVLWLLEELSVPYQIKRYQREDTLLAPDSLKKIHPLGKSPVITDGNRVIAESGAILEYLQQNMIASICSPSLMRMNRFRRVTGCIMRKGR